MYLAFFQQFWLLHFQKHTHMLMRYFSTLAHSGGGSTPFYSFWGCFFLTSQKLFVDENSTKSQNYPPKMINLSPKFIISPVNYKFPQKC